MSGHFYVLKRVDDGGTCLVFSTSFLSPCLTALAEDLRTCEYEGPVLFDMLLCNGPRASNRFLKGWFRAGTWTAQWTPFDPPPVVREHSRKFYQENPELLQAGILTRPAQFFLRKGIDI